MADSTMVCPRCSGTMMTFERASVQVDQCQNCKGIFLDRGELERLVQAEQSYYQQPPTPPQPAYQQPPAAYPPPAYDYDDHHGHGGHHGSRRRGFMHDLFD